MRHFACTLEELRKNLMKATLLYPWVRETEIKLAKAQASWGLVQKPSATCRPGGTQKNLAKAMVFHL